MAVFLASKSFFFGLFAGLPQIKSVFQENLWLGI